MAIVELHMKHSRRSARFWVRLLETLH